MNQSDCEANVAASLHGKTWASNSRLVFVLFLIGRKKWREKNFDSRVYVNHTQNNGNWSHTLEHQICYKQMYELYSQLQHIQSVKTKETKTKLE